MNEPSDAADPDAADGTDVVITPGGPRPRSSVHPVHPGEAVRRMPDGTNKVVPADSEDEPDDDVRQGDEQEGNDDS